MFLEGILDCKEGQTITKLARESTTYNAYYIYWRDQLFERIMRLFVWENTYNDENKVGIKPKEIEQRLILKGHCGITIIPDRVTKKKELSAMFGSFYGPTRYLDEFTSYTVRSPIYSGERTIGKDIVIIDNNSLRNPAFALVHHYATMLAHTEVTLVNLLVNARDSGGVPVASTEKQKQSIQAYQGRLYNGQYGVVTDLGALGVNYAGTNRDTKQDVGAILEAREKILKSFYSDIGVKSAFEKRNNAVEAEVQSDTSLLLLNLSDMIDSRKRGAEEVNKMFGTNWNVHIAKEIDYTMENEIKEEENEDENSK